MKQDMRDAQPVGRGAGGGWSEATHVTPLLRKDLRCLHHRERCIYRRRRPRVVLLLVLLGLCVLLDHRSASGRVEENVRGRWAGWLARVALLLPLPLPHRRLLGCSHRRNTASQHGPLSFVGERRRDNSRWQAGSCGSDARSRPSANQIRVCEQAAVVGKHASCGLRLRPVVARGGRDWWASAHTHVCERIAWHARDSELRLGRAGPRQSWATAHRSSSRLERLWPCGLAACPRRRAHRWRTAGSRAGWKTGWLAPTAESATHWGPTPARWGSARRPPGLCPVSPPTSQS